MTTHDSDSTTRKDSEFGELLEALFRDVHAELLGTLYYVVGNLEDARDAMQESFLKCWRNRDGCQDIRNLKAWVFRVTLNTGRDLRRTAWNRRREPLAEDTPMLSQPPESEAAVLHDERLELLRQAILTLRPEEQEVFLLRQNGGLSYQEIADATSLALGTVKTRMRTAIRRLREIADKAGFS
jgi:RNA polymerase sigma factor (sigma-70 family)